MNGARDQDPARAVDDQCSVIILYIGAEQLGSVNAEQPKQNQHNLCRSHFFVIFFLFLFPRTETMEQTPKYEEY